MLRICVTMLCKGCMLSLCANANRHQPPANVALAAYAPAAPWLHWSILLTCVWHICVVCAVCSLCLCSLRGSGCVVLNDKVHGFLSKTPLSRQPPSAAAKRLGFINIFMEDENDADSWTPLGVFLTLVIPVALLFYAFYAVGDLKRFPYESTSEVSTCEGEGEGEGEGEVEGGGGGRRGAAAGFRRGRGRLPPFVLAVVSLLLLFPFLAGGSTECTSEYHYHVRGEVRVLLGTSILCVGGSSSGLLQPQ
jgi:hypothetical protein